MIGVEIGSLHQDQIRSTRNTTCNYSTILFNMQLKLNVGLVSEADLFLKYQTVRKQNEKVSLGKSEDFFLSVKCCRHN